jgi:glutaredoxin 2
MNKNLFYLILAVVCVVCLASCKTAAELYNKAKDKNEEKVAELVRKDYPCTAIKVDSVKTIDTLYKTIDVQCPDTIQYRIDSFETSVAVKVPVYIKVKVPELVTNTITKIITTEDTDKINKLTKKLTDKDLVIVALEKKIEKKNKWIKWLIIVSIALSIPYILKLIKIIKP